MRRLSSFTAGYPAARRPENAKGAADFLRADDKMSAILPAAMRMAALQKDCADILPAMFENCAILQFESAQLVLSTPTAALAARLKQQLPKLQATLQGRGWQVNAIRLKVQVTAGLQKAVLPKQAILPGMAVTAFAVLEGSIEKTARNEGLIAAIAAMVRRHKR